MSHQKNEEYDFSSTTTSSENIASTSSTPELNLPSENELNDISQVPPETQLQFQIGIIEDVANWPKKINNDLRLDLIREGPEKFQNKEGPFEPAVRTGSGSVTMLKTKWFYRELKNGDRVLRNWLLYSPIDKGLYCFCCKLFLSANDLSPFVTKPFCHFWHLNPCLANHENSKMHTECFFKWSDLAVRLEINLTINNKINQAVNKERRKWKDILTSILAIVYLSKQNLAFRGHDESYISKNQGNFLELMKVIAKHNPTLQQHMIDSKFTKQGVATYLSPSIQNELIEILGKKVKQLIIDEIKEAKYFAIMLDSTPDVSHIDQMSLVIRFVRMTSNDVEIKESFVNFFPLHGKTAADITNSVLQDL